MNYSEPLPQQLFDFLFFFGFGFLDGLLFLIVEFFRKLFGNGKRAVIFQDIFFSVLSTVLMFVFLLVYADGVVRINLIAASVLGAAVFFLTAGKPVKRVLDAAQSVLKKTASFLTAPFFFVSKKLKKLFERIFALLKEKTKASKKKPKTEKERRKGKARLFRKKRKRSEKKT